MKQPPVPASAPEVRARLVEALKLDLVGPWAGHAHAAELLPGWMRPSNWYLTGFLIPSGTPPEKSADSDEDEELDTIPESAGLAEESNEDRKAAKKRFFPSSIGVSFLLPEQACALDVTVRWGDYRLAEVEGADEKRIPVWQRDARATTVKVPLARSRDCAVHGVPDSGGLQLHVVDRVISVQDLAEHLPGGTRSVSVFLVNHRAPDKDNPDLAFAFQAELEVRADCPFVPRPDLRAALTEDWDEQVGDLHYADTSEYATCHGVSADWEVSGGACRLLRTAWITSAEVEKTQTADVPGVELAMDALGALADGAAAEAALEPLVTQYRAWIQSWQSRTAALGRPATRNGAGAAPSRGARRRPDPRRHRGAGARCGRARRLPCRQPRRGPGAQETARD